MKNNAGILAAAALGSILASAGCLRSEPRPPEHVNQSSAMQPTTTPTSEGTGAYWMEHWDELVESTRDQILGPDKEAWFAFSAGVGMVEGGKPWHDVLDQWEKTLKAYPKSRYREQLQDYVEHLRQQVREEKEFARTAVKDPSTLPAQERAEYYVARFAEVQGRQWSQPGSCQTLGDEMSNAVVAIGWAAVPTLIEHLTDGRLTRSVGYWRYEHPSRTVLRVQDVAIACIDEILDIEFYERSNIASYLSTEDVKDREAVIADIRDWSAKYGDKPPVKGQVARLDKGCIGLRIDTLEKIERLDPKAVDSIATLKRWAQEAKTKLLGAADGSQAAKDWAHDINFRKQLPQIATALAERNDFSLMPEISKMVRDQGAKEVDEDYLAVLALYGTPEDLGVILQEIRKEGPKGGISRRVWRPWTFSEVGSRRPLAARILVPLLDNREHIATRSSSNSKTAVLSCADECMEALIRLTGHNEGYDVFDPDEKRSAAIDRWKAWWQKEGKADFIKKHPEVAAMFAETAESQPATQPSK